MASQVISAVPLTPHDEYEMMFRYPHENKGKETILRMSGYEKSSSISKLYDPSNSPKALPSPSCWRSSTTPTISAASGCCITTRFMKVMTTIRTDTKWTPA